VVDEGPKVVTLQGTDERSFQVTRTAPDAFLVTGIGIERTTRMTNFDQIDASNRFQRILETTGITKELNRQHVQPGDVVDIAGRELVWGDLEDLEPATTARRTARERYLNRKSKVDDGTVYSDPDDVVDPVLTDSES